MSSGDTRKVQSSVATFDCHQCSASFNVKSDLLGHIKNENHDVVKVICPFCVSKEPRIFKRVGDLRFHAKKKHPQQLELAPKGLFTTRTAFYFSLEPHKYIKDHKPESYEDRASIYARDLVTKWSAGRTPGITKWLEGWQLAKGPSVSSVKRPSTSLDLLDVIISPMEIKAHFSLGESYVMVKVDLGISADYRGMDSLTRRSRTLKPSISIPSGSWKVLHKPETRTEAAALLGIQEHYINIVLHKPKPHFPNKVAKTAAAEGESPQQMSPEVPAVEPDSPEAANTDMMKDLLQSCGILPPLSPIPSPTPIHLDDIPAENEVAQEDPFPTGSSPIAAPEDDVARIPTTVSTCNSPDVTPPSPSKIPSTNVISSNNDSKTVPYEPAMLDDNSSHSSYIPTPIISSDAIRKKAINLLQTGCMPLLPPARRDWNAIPEELIQLTTDMKWPPRNWKQLTPDQRSMSSEFAAMTLSRESNPLEYLSMDRFTMVHEFNFLVLPGSGCYRTDVKAKARIYNYQAVLDIITGKDPSPLKQQMDFLNCFQTTACKTRDQLLSKISSVPLKLK